MAKQEIQRVEPPQSPIMQLAAMVQIPDSKIDTAGLKELLAVQIAWEANEAKKAYVVAMAAFKADPPKIIKDKDNAQYNSQYASLANVTESINSSLSKQGLSASWLTGQKENGWPEVTCTITHVQGHSESTSLSAPPDESGKKNPIQRIISTVSYLQRATLLALTGLATYEQDDDGNAAGKPSATVPPPNDHEQKVILAICAAIVPPKGMMVDPKKVAAICYEKKTAYLQNITGAPGAAKWFIDNNRTEIFIDIPKDEFDEHVDNFHAGDVSPEEAESTAADKFGKENEIVECRFVCNACSHEYDNYKKIDQCPKCLTKDVTDRRPE